MNWGGRRLSPFSLEKRNGNFDCNAGGFDLSRI